ncbi:hypothetical protein MHO82_13095 [Vibrio sp. Of7-15]|uniref:hypothetical protein n=1 Tax=Vibrio sp. Of7-15 TaxID=2724879 RepID=UPI001EF28EB3|nr:hypothetical protein [Vibrio sp. Of7-15]MCG7497801.1 hypothetical protein [Vibrio sp. Of7-15]
MPVLLDLLQRAGLAELTSSSQTQEESDTFITAYSSAFDAVCKQKPDSTQNDLLLGFITKTYLAKREYYQAQEESMENMRQVFKDTVGKEHAGKFKSQESDSLQFTASVWFMVQGYTGIDYSYAYEHADDIAHLLSQQAEQIESIRSELMRSYYVGVEHSQRNKDKSSFISALTQPLRRWFKRH